MRALFRTGTLAVLALLPLGAGCSGAVPDEGSNLLLITVDTLRADHLGAHGDRLVDTPALDAFAARSLVFEEAWTPIPITTPALGSLMTSTLPQNHGALNNSYDLDASALTLADVLAGEGYATGAFLPSWLANKPGFRTGFEQYDAPAFGQPHRDGDEVVERALAWMEAREAEDARPWFVWVHLLEPHSPYEPGPELEAKYLPPDTSWVDPALRNEVFGESIPRTAEQVEIIRALYRGEVEATDRALAPLLDWVESHRRGGERAERGDVLTVFTADHGELLYEHEEYVGHTAWLWEEMLRVPLWFHWTSGREPARSSSFPASASSGST